MRVYYKIRIDGNIFSVQKFKDTAWITGQFDETEYTSKREAKYYAYLMEYKHFGRIKTIKKANKIKEEYPEEFL